MRGQASSRISIRLLPWITPRGCGDKLVRISAPVSAVGSPPRMRGQGDSGTAHTIYPGITPADAGTRCLDCRPMNQTGDHPRGCGDKPSGHCKKYRSGGSPPRMRGQVDPTAHDSRLGKDHPRGCGDKPSKSVAALVKTGSPPRMRGQGRIFSAWSTFSRITPADAGTR